MTEIIPIMDPIIIVGIIPGMGIFMRFIESFIIFLMCYIILDNKNKKMI